MKLRPLTRFQLTPLMDLLLIIVFAQFLEMRQTSRQQADTLQQEREDLTAQIARQRSELQGIEAAIRQELETLQSQRDDARAARDRAVADRDGAIQRSSEAMSLLANWLQIDPTKIESFGVGGDEAATASRRAAIQQAAELSQSQPTAILKFLISHAELLKRAEVWTVHTTAQGEIQLVAGDQTESFRLEAKDQAARTTEAADQLFAAYKQLPEPKSLVIFLVSFDPRSLAGTYQPLIDAVPLVLQRLRGDSPNTRFEYTVLGTESISTETAR